MSIQAIREYLALLWRVYRATRSKSRKSQILTEIQRNLGIHRNSAIRLMNSKKKPTKQRGSGSREKYYDALFQDELIKLWRAMGYMGSKKMVAAIPEWLPFHLSEGLTTEIRGKLLQVKPATVDRLLQAERAKRKRQQNTGTKKTYRLKKSIPIALRDENVDGPGHLQVDSVAHCGDSLSGNFAWTITCTDIILGWTYSFCVWHKNSNDIVTGLVEAESSFPFPVKSWRIDNGSEFVTEAMVNEFINRRTNNSKVKIFRSRPYKKNDQCFIEQKNWEQVRKGLGYARIDEKDLVPLINKFYKSYWNPLHNYFVPQAHLENKIRIGAKLKKTYDEQRTPIDRFLSLEGQNRDEMLRVIDEKISLNPIELRKQAIRLRKKILDAQETSDNRFKQSKTEDKSFETKKKSLLQ